MAMQSVPVPVAMPEGSRQPHSITAAVRAWVAMLSASINPVCDRPWFSFTAMLMVPQSYPRRSIRWPTRSAFDSPTVATQCAVTCPTCACACVKRETSRDVRKATLSVSARDLNSPANHLWTSRSSGRSALRTSRQTIRSARTKPGRLIAQLSTCIRCPRSNDSQGRASSTALTIRRLAAERSARQRCFAQRR